jgi:hypothetical protein
VQHAYQLTIPQSLKEACDPARLALIVYDMQVGILSQISDGAVGNSQCPGGFASRA